MTHNILIPLIGYLAGCFQPSYILYRLIKKEDIRKTGSGNAGASNTVISLGWRYGILVALLDIGKSVISILVVKILFHNILSPESSSFYLLLNGLFVIIGHNHPFFMGFRGGKGTASLIGMLLVIDIRIALICILAILMITVVTNYIAIGTIAMVLVMVVSSLYFRYSAGCTVILFIIAIMAILNHLPNIRRIYHGTETGLRKTFPS